MFRHFLASVLRPSGARHVLGINARNRAVVRTQNPRRYFPLADDKIQAIELLKAAGIPVPRTLHVVTTMRDARLVVNDLKELDDYVIKPAKGRGGIGIVIMVESTRSGWLDHSGTYWSPSAVSRHISSIVYGNYSFGLWDRALIDERLLQMPLLGDEVFPGLPDIRVIMFRGVAIMSMLRLPTALSKGKANIHQGGVGVGVDLSTGRCTCAVFRGDFVDEHPDSGCPIVGQTVAHWSSILDIARRAAAAHPLGYLGVDIAVDRRKGPVVLEVNARPGLEIQNANLRGLRAELVRMDLLKETW